MTLLDAWFTTKGKIKRLRFWLFLFVLWVLGSSFIGGVAVMSPKNLLPAVLFWQIVSLYPTVCVFVNRGNDLNLSRYVSVSYVVLPFLLVCTIFLFKNNLSSEILGGMWLGQIIISLIAVVHLGFFPGKMEVDKETPERAEQIMKNTLPIRGDSRQEPNFDQAAHNKFSGEAHLSNDAYKIYLTKAYRIEYLSALNKYALNEKLYDSVDECLAIANENYQNEKKCPKYADIVTNPLMRNFFEQHDINVEKYASMLNGPPLLKAVDGIVLCPLCNTRNWHESVECKFCKMTLNISK